MKHFPTTTTQRKHNHLELPCEGRKGSADADGLHGCLFWFGMSGRRYVSDRVVVSYYDFEAFLHTIMVCATRNSSLLCFSIYAPIHPIQRFHWILIVLSRP